MKKRLTLLVGPGRKEGSRGEVAVVTALASLCQHLPVPHSLTVCSALLQYFSLPLLLINCEPAVSWRHSGVLSLMENCGSPPSWLITVCLCCKGSSPPDEVFSTIFIFPTLLSPYCSAIIQHTRATAFFVLCHCCQYLILEFGVLLRFQSPYTLKTTSW